MLSLDQPQDIAGVQLFADHRDPDLFHYLPTAPLLAGSDESPGLSLVTFRGAVGADGESIRGGAFLSLELHCGPTDSQLEQVRAALAADIPAARLVPVAFTSGAARLLLPGGLGDEGTGLPVRLVGASSPSLQGRQTAVFGVTLGPEEAVLVEAALDGSGSLPLVAALDLEYEGLHPARRFRVEVNYEQVYEVLQARAAVGSLWLRAAVDQALESLEREGAIRIEDAAFEELDPSELDARHEELLALARKLGTEAFWEPVPVAAAASTSGSVEAAQAPITTAFRLLSAEQAQSRRVSWDQREVGVRTRRIVPQAALRLSETVPPEAWLTRVPLDESGPHVRRFRALVPEGSDWSGVASLVVDLRSGGTVETIVLDPEHPSGSVLLPDGGLEQRVRVLRSTEPQVLGLGGASDELSQEDWGPAELWSLALDPSTAAGWRWLRCALGVHDPELLETAHLKFEAGTDSREELLTAESPEVRVAVARELEVELRATLAYQPSGGAAVVEIPVERRIPPSEQTVLVEAPSARLLRVVVLLADPFDRYEAVHVELDRGDALGRRLVVLDASQPRGAWSAVLEPGMAGRFRWRARNIVRGGEDSQGDWQVGTGSLLVVGDTDIEVREVSVLLLDAGEHLGGTLSLTLHGAPAGLPTRLEHMLDGGEVEVVLRVPVVRGGAGLWTVEAAVWDLQGEEIRFGPTESSDEVVVLVPSGP